MVQTRLKPANGYLSQCYLDLTCSNYTD